MDVSYHYKGLDFEWDSDKEKINIRKHGVSFEESASSFLDYGALVREDLDHSENEERFILVGLDAEGKVLFVSFCERKLDLIRIISARKANKKEEKQYRQRQ